MTKQDHQDRLSIGALAATGEHRAAEASRDDQEPSSVPFDEWELMRAVFRDALCILLAAALLFVALFPFVTSN